MRVSQRLSRLSRELRSLRTRVSGSRFKTRVRRHVGLKDAGSHRVVGDPDEFRPPGDNGVRTEGIRSADVLRGAGAVVILIVFPRSGDQNRRMGAPLLPRLVESDRRTLRGARRSSLCALTRDESEFASAGRGRGGGHLFVRVVRVHVQLGEREHEHFSPADYAAAAAVASGVAG